MEYVEIAMRMHTSAVNAETSIMKTLILSSAMSVGTVSMAALSSISWQNLVSPLTTWKVMRI
jgi:hypothetical protein